MTLLAPLVLVLALPAQDPQPDAREQAAAWRQDAPSAETLLAAWRDGDRARRIVLADAAVRYPAPVVLPLLQAALEDGSVAAAQPRRDALIDAALALGELPGSGVLAGHRDEGVRRFGALLELGWLPPARVAAAVLADDDLRQRALQAWAFRPDDFPQGLQTDPAWPAYDAMLAGLLQARRDPAMLAGNARAWIAEVVGGGHYAAARAPAIELLRELGPVLPADALDGTWAPLAPALRAVLLPVLEEAPAELAWGPLRDLALEPVLGMDQRGAAVRRMFGLDGPRAARDLLVLVDRATPAPLLQPLLLNLRTWADAPTCGVLEATLGALPEESRGLALEVLALRGDAQQARLWEVEYEALPSRTRRGLLRAALTAGQPGVLERIWETVNGPASELRTDAETVLREFVKEPELVSGFVRGVARMDSVDARVQQWTRVARLRVPEAEPPLRRALEDPELAAHPLAYALAGRLLEHEGSAELFRSWWKGETEVDANARFVAALALFPEDPDCETHVIEELLNVDQGLLLATVSAVRAHPTVAMLAASRVWAYEPALPDVVRREFAGTVALGMETEPHARVETVTMLRTLEASFRASVPVDIVGAALCLGAYQFGDDALRDLVDQVVATGRRSGAGGADALDQRLDSHRARLGRPGYEPQAVVARVVAGLRNPSSAADPGREPAIPEIARAHQPFDWALQMMAAQETGAVLPLLEAAVSDSAGPWHPDLLWLAARRMDRPHPPAAELFDAVLARTEPLASKRRPHAATEPPPAALEADAQRFFERIEEVVLSGDLEAADRWLAAGLVRHAGDRRIHQWQGWVHIARAQLDDAEASFRLADQLGGMTPYLHLEQTLGLAVVAELRDPGSDDFERFMDYEEQAGRLLARRLPIAARPDLAYLVPPEEFEALEAERRY